LYIVDTSDGRVIRGGVVVALGMALHLADFILKLSTRVFKGIINRECEVGMPLIRRRCPCDIDFSTVREGEPYMDIV
jgi:hypothetical protein